MQIFPQANSADANGFDLMNMNPASDMAERTAMFADVMSQEGVDANSVDKILGFARQGMEQAEKAATGAAENGIKAAKTLGNQGLKAGLTAMARLKAVSSAANSPSAKDGGQVDFGRAFAQQAIKDFTSMKTRSDENPQTLKMTGRDWAGLKQDLLDYGLNEADLDDLESRINSKTGLSWGEFVHFLNGNTDMGMPTVDFSDSEKQGLAAFFSQMGFTTGESEGLIRNLSQRQYGDVFQAVSARIDTMAENGDSPGVGRSELESFISALRLSKNASSQLKQLLGSNEDFSLGELKRLMSSAKKDIMLGKSERTADDAELAKLVNDALKKALAKHEDTLQSDRHGDDAAEKRIKAEAGISKDIMSGKDADGQGNETAKPSVAAKNGKEAAETAGKTLFAKLGNATKDGNAELSKDGTADSAETTLQKFADRLANAGGDRHKSGEELFEQGDGEGGETELSKSWKEFFSRLKVDDSAGTAKTLGTVMDEALAATEGKTGKANVELGATRENVSSRTMFDQINNGVFKNLGQGRKQLTLQLTPEDLGTLNVVLQVRNKEVRALIKTDNPEATRLVGEQLEAIKQTLQEQGLKVSKLDVQTSTTGNQDSANWQGESGHNRAMEQEEAARTLTRWRNMKGEGESLAQEMQNPDVRENLSQSGLHIVA